MGVVYKVKPEIVEFIISTKSKDRSVSCRALVGLVQDQFHVKVSKSSVNSVLKGHQLSDRVGRKPVHRAPKNFAIPKEKKAFLREKVSPFLKSSEVQAPGEAYAGTCPQIQQDDPKTVEILSQAVPSQGRPQKSSFSNLKSGKRKKDAHLLPDIFSNKEEVERIAFNEDESGVKLRENSIFDRKSGVNSDFIGFFVFLAMIQDADPQNQWSAALLERMGLDLDSEKVLAFQFLCLIQALGQEQGLDSQGLEQDMAQTFSVSEGEIRLWKERLEALKSDKKTGYALSASFESMKTMALDVSLEIEDASMLYTDPFWIDGLQEAPCSRRKRPLLSTILSATDMWVSGVEPLVLGRLGLPLSDKQADIVFKALLAEKQIKKIKVLGRESELLWEYSDPVALPKDFILGVEVNDDLLSRVDMDDVGAAQVFYDSYEGQSFVCVQGRYSLGDQGQRLDIYVLTHQDSGERLALLSNMSGGMERVLGLYSSRRCGILNHYDSKNMAITDGSDPQIGQKLRDSGHIAPLESVNVLVILRAAIEDFWGVFFEESFSGFLKTASLLRGRVSKTSSQIIVCVEPTSASVSFEQLAIFFKMLNTLGLNNSLGQQYYFHI